MTRRVEHSNYTTVTLRQSPHSKRHIGCRRRSAARSRFKQAAKNNANKVGDSVRGAETQTDSRKLSCEVRAQLLTISALPPPECFQEDRGCLKFKMTPGNEEMTCIHLGAPYRRNVLCVADGRHKSVTKHGYLCYLCQQRINIRVESPAGERPSFFFDKQFALALNVKELHFNSGKWL